jgi:catechol 2,3-dioxygenase-like lactoylglutathione lyase family enzyme
VVEATPGEEVPMAEFPAPKEGIALTHFIVSDDVERSRRFYADVLGGETVMEGEPTIVALANGWIIINVGGGLRKATKRRGDVEAPETVEFNGEADQ